MRSYNEGKPKKMKRPVITTNRISKLKTRYDFVFRYYFLGITENIKDLILETKKWGQVVLPVNFAKTLMMFMISFWFIRKEKQRLFFITSDQTGTVSKRKLKWERNIFKKFIEKNGYDLEDEYNITSLQDIDEMCNDLRDNPKSIGVLSCSDSWFISNHQKILSIIRSYGLDNQTVWHNDESARGASSSHETTEGNTGIAQDATEYKATKYKTYLAIKNHIICIGYTGNRVKEHHDIDFGTEDYVTLNEFPTKDETWTMMSAHRTPIYIDLDRPMEYNLSLGINECFKRQQEQDIHTRENGLLNIGKKHTFLVQLAHGNTPKNNRHILIKTLESMKVEPHWIGMHLGFTSSNGIQVFNFTKKGVIELSKDAKEQYGYFDDSTLRQKFNDENSPLRTLCIIEKGLKGSNDPTQTTYMSFRPYTTKGVEHNEEQGDGRLKRMFEMIEDIIESVDNAKTLNIKSKKDLFIETWYLMNTYQSFIPSDSGYTRMYEKTAPFFCSAEEVIDKLKKMDW